jgi:16S rRNA (guanine(966)-N(2))-methyltransferase RsmD
VRIISGKYRGRTLHPPKGLPVRPTTDFAKSGLFNILNNRLDYESCLVLDLCCGTGNITFEFASRGAQKIIAVDEHAACLKFISDTIRQLDLPNVKTFKSDIFKFIEKTDEKFDLIFADPPYEAEWIERIAPVVFEKNLLNEDGMLIIEHSDRTDLSAQPHFQERRNYGNVNFSFFSAEAN